MNTLKKEQKERKRIGLTSVHDTGKINRTLKRLFREGTEEDKI